MEPRTDKRTMAARAFVRSLNILLKFARMYDFGHPRTAKQYETAWAELRTALGDSDAGLLLAVSGEQLLLDGTALESAAAERSFARMLSASGIASIFFSSKVTQASLAKFVRGFPTGTGAKPGQLAEQLKAALQGDANIHVNEVCFVPADSAVAKTTVAAQLAARTLGLSSVQQDEMLQDPEKLLQLIIAAEGMRSAGGGAGDPGGGGDRSGPGGFGTGGGSSGGSSSSAGGTGVSTGDALPGCAGSGAFNGPVAPVGGIPGGSNAGGASQGSPGDAPSSGSPVGAPNTWNVIGGSGEGGGTPIDANAGGFWFNSPGADSSSGKSGGAGAGKTGPGNASLAGPISSVGASNDAGTGGAGNASITGSISGNVGPDSPTYSAFRTVGRATSGNRGREGSRVPFSTMLRTESSPLGRWENASAGIRESRRARPGAGGMAVETGLMTLHEGELQGILQVLAQIARTSGQEKLEPTAFQSRLSSLPRRARFTVSQALSALAAQAPAVTEPSDKPILMKLAEHIAVRYALEDYERGNLKVNAVRQLLDEMSQELDGLRKIVGTYEEQMTRAGIALPSQTDMLAQQFWAQVSEEKKKSVLESDEAWCVPPSKLSEYVGVLRSKGENEAAEKILRNYANCITSTAVEARHQAASGLAEVASLLASGDDRLLIDTIRLVGVQLAQETDPELQSLMSAAFVRLTQEAAKKRSYPAVQRSVELMDYIEAERPAVGKTLRPRIAVENRLPDFIEEAVRTGEVPGGLKDLLRRLPTAASEQIAGRFSRSGFREDCELLISMMELLGPEALDHLRQVLRNGTAGEAVDVVGILTRMDIDAVGQLLPGRISEWKRTAHDRVVRQIAASGSPERGQLLLEILDDLDVLIRPLAVERDWNERRTRRRHSFPAAGGWRHVERRDRVLAAESHRGAWKASHRRRGGGAEKNRGSAQDVPLG